MKGYVYVHIEPDEGGRYYVLVRIEKIPEKMVLDIVYDDVYDICESWKLFDFMTDEERADVLELVKLLRGKPSGKHFKDLEEKFWAGAATYFIVRKETIPVKFYVESVEDKESILTPDKFKMLKKVIESSKNLEDLENNVEEPPSWARQVLGESRAEIIPYVYYEVVLDDFIHVLYREFRKRGWRK
jgi:hypothetical protein